MGFWSRENLAVPRVGGPSFQLPKKLAFRTTQSITPTISRAWESKGPGSIYYRTQHHIDSLAFGTLIQCVALEGDQPKSDPLSRVGFGPAVRGQLQR